MVYYMKNYLWNLYICWNNILFILINSLKPSYPIFKAIPISTAAKVNGKNGYRLQSRKFQFIA